MVVIDQQNKKKTIIHSAECLEKWVLFITAIDYQQYFVNPITHTHTGTIKRF